MSASRVAVVGGGITGLTAAVTLLGLAALSVTPWLASLVKQRVTGPASKRGNARTLANIRDGGVGEFGYEGYNFDDLESEELPPVRE